jgi:hypothetical protein
MVDLRDCPIRLDGIDIGLESLADGHARGSAAPACAMRALSLANGLNHSCWLSVDEPPTKDAGSIDASTRDRYPEMGREQ